MEYGPAGRCLLPTRRGFGVRHQGLSRSTRSQEQTSQHWQTLSPHSAMGSATNEQPSDNLTLIFIHFIMPGLKLQQTTRAEAQVVLLACPHHASFTPAGQVMRQAILCQLRKIKFSWITTWMGFFLILIHIPKVVWQPVQKYIEKRNPHLNLRKIFLYLTSLEAELHPYLQITCLWLSCQMGISWEKSNLRPFPCFYMEKSQPQFFPLKTSVLRVPIPRLHLGIYIAVGAFPPVFTTCPLTASLRYSVLRNTNITAASSEQLHCKKNQKPVSEQMCRERGALRHPSN